MTRKTAPPAGDLALAPLCAAAAAGRGSALAPLAKAALAAGWTPAEVREALLTLAPFCGFPRTLDAFAEIRDVVPPVKRVKPDPRAASRGAAFFDRVYGKDASRVRANIRGLDREVAMWIEADAYGKVLSRRAISASLRERISVVLLAAQGLRKQLSGHVRGAINCGATATEVAEFVEAAGPYLAETELAFAREMVRRFAGT